MGRHSSNDLQDRRALPGAVPRFTGKLLTDRRPGNRRGNISERDVSRSARDQPLSPRALIRGSMRSHAASILTNRRFPEMLEILRDPPEMEASIFRYRVTHDDSSPPPSPHPYHYPILKRRIATESAVIRKRRSLPHRVAH